MAKRILNAGAGMGSARRLQPLLSSGWEEVRFDIDPAVQPDVIGSINELDRYFPQASFDAIHCSHVVEHLYAHEVYPALVQFRRILKPTGFALVMTPDLDAVAQFIVEKGLVAVAYQSPAGPIRPLDMIYGHTEAIEAGRTYMAHRTGFSTERLANLMLEAGFSVVNVRSEKFELCALACASSKHAGKLQDELAASGVDFRAQAT